MIPEQKYLHLWTEVLLLAVDDIHRRSYQWQPRYRREAVIWLMLDNRKINGFLAICHMLNQDPEKIRRAVLGDSWYQWLKDNTDNLPAEI